MNTPQVQLLVYRPSGVKTFPVINVITIGRQPGNDIVLGK